MYTILDIHVKLCELLQINIFIMQIIVNTLIDNRFACILLHVSNIVKQKGPEKLLLCNDHISETF